MTIIAAVREYMLNAPMLEGNAIVLIDSIGQPIQYAIIPLPGEQIVEQYINGVTVREFPFLFQTAKSTADDLERLETAEFHEALMDWFEERTEENDLPQLDANKTAESIEAVNWGYLFEQGESDTGIYQITCRLRYRQEAYTPAQDSGSI